MKKNNLIRFLLLFLLNSVLNTLLYSQVYQEWVQKYSGSAEYPDEGYSIAADNSGNIYVSGYTALSSTNWDYLTIKYDANGAQQWIKTYNGSGNGMDYSISMDIDNLGNIYVTGSSYETGTGSNFTTIKYNTNGMQMWIQSYSGTGNNDDAPYEILVDESGNVYVSGWSYRSGTGFDYLTIKYNTEGVQQWTAFYNGTGNNDDFSYAIAVDNSGDVYVTGESSGIGTFSDHATIKYNSAGVQQWVQRYNGPGNSYDFAHSISIDISGNVLVTGESAGNGTGSDLTTIKYNANGIQQWVQRYNGSANSADAGYCILTDKSENIYVSGFSTESGTGRDFITIKYNKNGIPQWIGKYNGLADSSDEATWMTTDSVENIYITGFVTGSATGTDYATIKYDPNGNQKWIQTYNGTGYNYDVAWSIAADKLGNLYVTGASTGSGSGKDCLTIKYSQPIGIKQISSIIPEYYILYQNYPNPFNPVTKIKFDIPAESNVFITIYNILGKEISNVVNERLVQGSYEVNWDASNYPSGIYYYKLSAGNFNETKKMILLK